MYDAVANKNKDGRVASVEKFEDISITIPFDVDFTDRIFTYEYYSVLDLITLTGGMLASAGFLGWIVIYFIPIWGLYHLYLLSSTFKEKAEYEFKKQLVNFL